MLLLACLLRVCYAVRLCVVLIFHLVWMCAGMGACPVLPEFTAASLFFTKVCFAMLSNALHACTLLRDADRISQLSRLGRWLYVAERTPRGTGMGCNDLTSPVLQLRKYQTRSNSRSLRACARP
jgi:hypothetical protein